MKLLAMKGAICGIIASKPEHRGRVLAYADIFTEETRPSLLEPLFSRCS
jgi:hypothetical protein